MIVNLDIIKQEEALKDVPDKKIIRKTRVIEKAIRKHTNNNFIDPNFRFSGKIIDGQITTNAFLVLKENDNVQLSHSFNNGVYTIKTIEKGKIVLDETNLVDCENIIVTKVVYPEDVQEGVINMLVWDFTMRNKVGIKSESISRHNVTYFDMDHSNTLKGYPISLIEFIDDYMKARF